MSGPSDAAGEPAYRLLPGVPAPPAAGEAEVVGGKAANLFRLAAAGLPVPPGFVLPTATCRAWLARPEATQAELRHTLRRELAALEQATGRRLGDRRRPLLVSVRSGAAVSMPGMLETVLDVGLTRTACDGLIRLTGNPRLAWDCRRRLVQQFAEVVHGAPARPFARAIDEAVAGAGAGAARVGELDYEQLEQLCDELHRHYRAHVGAAFPEDAFDQLEQATVAVLASWRSERAVAYRRLNGIAETGGTAVLVQAMVFGNAGADSGAGVGFSRDPATGAAELYVDFLFGAQGEDVVSGRSRADGGRSLGEALPGVARELAAMAAQLEAEFRDMQDFEFTVERGRLFLLQARAAKRTPYAALVTAVAMVDEGLIEPAEALARLAGLDLAAVERRSVVPPQGVAPVARAIPAGIGVAVGRVAFDREAVERFARRSEPVVLVRPEASTEDLPALALAEGLLTAAGARTSHAAVVARQLGKVCLVGCRTLAFDPEARTVRIGGEVLREGDLISLDGNDGAVYAAAVEVRCERPDDLVARVAAWRAAAPA